MKQNKGFLKGALCGALAVLLAAGLVSCGIKLNSGKAEDKKLALLKSLIDEKYLRKADEEKLSEGIFKGYISGLEDPYSVYYDKEETKQLMETTSGEYKGIGAVLTQNKDTGIISIVQVYQDSPAMKAGVLDGDILYKVNGEEVTGQDLTKVVSRIKGDDGTTVELTLIRGAEGEEHTVTATRGTVEVQTITYDMKPDNIGYIRISEFDTITEKQYEEALNDLKSQNMQGLVVDLRSNPGGNLDTVCNMLDMMLPEGILVYTEDKNGTKEERTSDAEQLFDLPLTVLVNENSASASEIFAGAIQDYGAGKIVGTQTYGKGVVQQVLDLGDGTCLKLTISEYFTPKGRNIDGEGITPDVEAEYVYDENNVEADNQLDQAVEVLRQEMQQ